MQCQICHKKTATIHLTEITNGVRQEMHMCEDCALEQGVTAKNQLTVNELLSQLLASQPSNEELDGPSEEVCCPLCGFALKQFRKQGVLGCPHDYELFEKELLPLIESAHGGRTRHCGKVPARLPSQTRHEIELSHLREQLKIAIEKENYELAARLRDQIQEMELN